MPKKHILGTSLLYLTTMLWGSSFIPQKWLLTADIPPFYMIALRFMFIIVLFPFIPKKSINRRTFLYGSILGFFLFTAFSLQTYGLKDLDVSVSAFLTGTNLIFIPIFYFVIFKKPVPPLNIMAILLAVVGIFYFNYQPGTNSNSTVGILCTMGAAMAFALHVIFSSRFLEKGENTLTLYIFQCASASTFAFMVAPVFETFPQTWSLNSVLALLYLGIGASILCYGLQMYGQKLIKDPVKIGLILALEPLWATLIAIPVFGETFSTYKIVGICFLVIAIAVCEGQSYYSLKKSHNI